MFPINLRTLFDEGSPCYYSLSIDLEKQTLSIKIPTLVWNGIQAFLPTDHGLVGQVIGDYVEVLLNLPTKESQLPFNVSTKVIYLISTAIDLYIEDNQSLPENSLGLQYWYFSDITEKSFQIYISKLLREKIKLYHQETRGILPGLITVRGVDIECLLYGFEYQYARLFNFTIEVSKEGYIFIQIPGDACCLQVEDSDRRQEGGYQLSEHNLGRTGDFLIMLAVFLKLIEEVLNQK